MIWNGSIDFTCRLLRSRSRPRAFFQCLLKVHALQFISHLQWLDRSVFFKCHAPLLYNSHRLHSQPFALETGNYSFCAAPSSLLCYFARLCRSAHLSNLVVILTWSLKGHVNETPGFTHGLSHKLFTHWLMNFGNLTLKKNRESWWM